MATVLDISLLRTFDVVYAWLFVFAISWAILEKTKLVGRDIKLINAIISFALATMFLLSSTAVQVINYIIPWFVVAIVFFILMILIFQMFGAEDKDIRSALNDTTLRWTLIGVGIVIVIAGFGNVLGQSLLEQSQGGVQRQEGVYGDGGVGVYNQSATAGVQGGDFEGNIFSTLFHPKVLGMLILFGIAVFAIALLTG